MMEDFVDELLLEIFNNLDVKDLLNATLVSKSWFQIGKSRLLWKRHVLRRWPSQNWLYSKVPVNNLNWRKIYQEFVQYGWYSPDQMRYFITCNTLEDEPISPMLRETMFLRMAAISQKWLQAAPLDHDGDMVSRHFNENMELFFNVRQLQWMFLDKRRGYMDKIYSRKLRYGKIEDYIRPYQVIPSCLLMYRFLCIFRSLAIPETGLTFYRIWRFRLKHMKTGMIFELCDWKAAASNTLSNGYPKISSYREDALELIHFLTHPHFIMQPLGLNTRLERIFHYAIHASAGGSLNSVNRRYDNKGASKRRKRIEPSSPRSKAAVTFGKQLYDKLTFPDIDEKLEQWRARRKTALLQGQFSPRYSLNTISVDNTRTLFSFPSCSTLASENESESVYDSSSATEDSQREFTPSDSESEFEFFENGYNLNCEYFISNYDCLQSVEDQHTLQASIADLWIINDRKFTEKIPVIFDVDDKAWYFSIERSCQKLHTLQLPHSPNAVKAQVAANCSDSNIQGAAFGSDNNIQGAAFGSDNNIQGAAFGSDNNIQGASTIDTDLNKISNTVSPKKNVFLTQNIQNKRKLSRSSSPSNKLPSLDITINACANFSNCVNSNADVIEALPSSLALYRLICLFEFNCSTYVSLRDESVWQVSMLHKKTCGIIHFSDYNGHFRVAVSLPHGDSLKQTDRSVAHKDLQIDDSSVVNCGNPQNDDSPVANRGNLQSNDNSVEEWRIQSGDSANDFFDSTEFRAAVTQLLDLLMSESFCHPYGIIAGTVA